MRRAGPDLPRARQGGFSLIEMMIATALLLAVTGAAISVLEPGAGTYTAQTEVGDLLQRLRVGADALRRDLLMAGAGTYTSSAVGPLVHVFAPLLPRRVGILVPGSTDQPDPAAITIMYVPATAAQTTTRTDLTSESAELQVHHQPGCPVGDPLCGFTRGMRVLLFEASGAYDVFTVTSVQGGGLRVQHRDQQFTTPYPAGSFISEVVSRTYYLNAAEGRLYVFDGYGSSLPLVENVVGLRFEYFGEPAPPVLRTAPAGTVPHAATYGPSPPAPGADNQADAWGAGENCTFSMSGGTQVSRLPDLGGTGARGLIPIPYSQLADGPWCPGLANGAGVSLPNRFDADMLRVRRVRVTLRVQVGSEALRGVNPAGQVLFARPGTARHAERVVPDQEIRFDVTPRNLNVGR